MNQLIPQLYIFFKKRIGPDCSKLILRYANLYCYICEQYKLVERDDTFCYYCDDIYYYYYCHDCRSSKFIDSGHCFKCYYSTDKNLCDVCDEYKYINELVKYNTGCWRCNTNLNFLCKNCSDYGLCYECLN